MKSTRFIKYKILFIVTYVAFIYVHQTFKNFQTTETLLSSSTVQSCVDSNLRTGRCVNLAICPQLVEEFYTGTRTQTITVDFQTFISDSICGFDGRNFLICCVGPTSSRPTRLQTSPNRTPTSDLSLGSLFQFAPLTELSNGGSAFFTSPQTPAVVNPNPTNIPPPVVFQTTTQANPTVMVLPTPVVQPPLQPPVGPTTTPPIVLNPASPSIVLNPIPTTSPNTNNIPNPIQQPVSSMQPPSVVGECGVSRGTTNRVVGGTEAKRGAYPWIAALGYYDEFDRNNLRFQCGGSLISQRYILTSAHCINPSLAVVRLGAHDLTKPLETNAMDFRISRTILHEGFDMRSIANDIALIELNSLAPLSAIISTICLPDGANFLNQDFVGMQPFIAGWGAAKHQGATSNILKDAQVPIVSRQTCEASYKTVFRFIEFSDKLICAGNANFDACQGDSGGPLMLPTQTADGSYRYFLLGIVSYGYECARIGFPGVYTRVASYIPWIRANIS